MKKTAFILIVSINLFACNSENGEQGTEQKADSSLSEKHTSSGKLSQLSWMDGGWKMNMPDGTLNERWRTMSDTEMVGSSELVSEKGDTMFSEKIRIVLRDNSLWYIPVVSNQNDGKEVLFKEKSVSPTEIIFENPAHDYPQRIIYNKKSATEMHARIEGNVSGLAKGEDFNYNRLIRE